MEQNELKDFLEKKRWPFTEKGPQVTIPFSGGEGEICITFSPRGERVRVALPVDICHWVDQCYALQKADTEYLIKKDNLRSFFEKLEEQFSYLFSPAKGKKEEEWLKKKEALLKKNKTERLTEINSREGQKLLRDLLLEKYHSCVIIPEISCPDLLIASHIKPWGECDDDPAERLNENNCLLLSVALDKLFDKYFISFDAETGEMLVSDEIDRDTLSKLGVVPEKMKLKIANSEQADFLRYHNCKLRKSQSPSK